MTYIELWTYKEMLIYNGYTTNKLLLSYEFTFNFSQKIRWKQILWVDILQY
jgi:hypothetical protein